MLLGVKGKQFIKKLKKYGVEITKGRGKGGHCLGFFKGKQTTIKIHGDKDLGKVYMKLVCKQLGINPSDIF